MKILVCILLLTTVTLAQEVVEENISPLALSIIRLLSSAGSSAEKSLIERLIALLSQLKTTNTSQSPQRSNLDQNSDLKRSVSLGSAALENSIFQPQFNPKYSDKPIWKGLAPYKTIAKPASVSELPNPDSVYVPISVPGNPPNPFNIRQPDLVRINTQPFGLAKKPVQLPVFLLLGIPVLSKGEPQTYGIDQVQGVPIKEHVPVLEKEPFLQRVVRGLVPQPFVVREQEGVPQPYIGREQVGASQQYVLRQVPIGRPLLFK